MAPPDPLPHPVNATSLEMLNLHLAAVLDMGGQVRQVRESMRGPGTAVLAEQLGNVSAALDYYSDLIAAYVVGFDSLVQEPMQATAARSFLLPYPPGIADGQQHARAVARTLWELGQAISRASNQAMVLGDTDTASLFTIVARGIDRQCWMVESLIVFDWNELCRSWTLVQNPENGNGASRAASQPSAWQDAANLSSPESSRAAGTVPRIAKAARRGANQ